LYYKSHLFLRFAFASRSHKTQFLHRWKGRMGTNSFLKRLEINGAHTITCLQGIIIRCGDRICGVKLSLCRGRNFSLYMGMVRKLQEFKLNNPCTMKSSGSLPEMFVEKCNADLLAARATAPPFSPFKQSASTLVT